MKHGISPTTPRRLRRERLVFLSKPLVYRTTDEEGRWHYHPTHMTPPTGLGIVETVVAPVKGKTYHKPAGYAKEFGRARRTRLCEERLAA